MMYKFYTFMTTSIDPGDPSGTPALLLGLVVGWYFILKLVLEKPKK